MVLETDIAIAGGGPAGLALAAELADLGVAVTLVDPSPEETWAQSYGTWAWGVRGLHLEDAVAYQATRPVVRTDEATLELPAAYVRFDTRRLQDVLLRRARRAGVEFSIGTVDTIEAVADGTTHLSVRDEATSEPGVLRARLAVDARGRHSGIRRGHEGTVRGFQSAYGKWLEVDQSPYSSGEMSLMDLRSVPGDSFELPTFLYAMPEAPGRLFVQETVLASPQPVSMAHLRARLERRLRHMGIRGRLLGEEECVIPLGGGLPDSGTSVLPYGAAAGMVHPASGYQIGRALRDSSRIAQAVEQALKDGEHGSAHLASAGMEALWPDPLRRSWALHHFGLSCLMGFDARRLEQFLLTFFDLPTKQWLDFMEGTSSPSEVSGAMWRLFLRAPGRLRLELVKGGARHPDLLGEAFS